MAELDVKDVYAALGMSQDEQPEVAEPAEGQGEKEPSPTGTDGRATENDNVDAAAEETSDPEILHPEKTEDHADAETESENKTKQKPDAMSRAERAEQARLRREREQKAAVDAAVAAERERLNREHAAELEEVFSKAGMTDRYSDGKPIKTMEEFRSWNEKAQAAGLSRRLQEGKLSPEDLQQAVEGSEAVRAAKAAVERLEAREQEQLEAARRAEFEQRVKEELAEIHRMDPSVNTLQDILAMPTGDAFAGYVREKGLSFLDAFKLANADAMAEAKARAASEGAARNAASKGHLRSINSPAGGVSVDVPKEVVKLYRDLRPDLTMEQIRQDYARTMRG